MSTGGSKQAATQTQVSDVPDWAKPYYTQMLGATQSELFNKTVGPDGKETFSLKPYEAYGGPRIAGSDQFGDIGASQAAVRGIAGAGTPMLDEAAGIARGVSSGAQGIMSQGPATFSQYGGFQAGTATPYSGFSQAGFNEFGFGPAGEFSGDAISRYMDPYIQNVVDIQKERALEDYGITRGARSARAVQAGAFGGSRAAVQEGLAERDLLNRQDAIQAQGLSTAYGDAQRMFEQDRAARMATEQARAAEAARVQSGIAGEMGRVQGAQAAEQARVQGISIDEAARVQAAQAAEAARVEAARAAEGIARGQMGLQALGLQAQQAGQLATIGEQERAAQIQNAQMLEAIGRAQQAEAQAGLDIGYQDFLRQQNYPMEQLGQYSSVLRGLPVAAAGTSTTYQPYNPMQQALGAGLSGLSLYRAFS